MDQGRLAGPLSMAVANLCRGLQRQVSARTAAGFAQVTRRLAAPLQVAVAGRIKSGKSTLVNALIGRRVAPTDVGECTRLVTRFQYGTVDRIEVVFTSGHKQVLPFAADGTIPADLGGVAIADVSHIEAYLTNAVLDGMTVIDTPGLGSVDAASVSRTEELLGAARQDEGADELDDISRNAVAGAEAVLYVVTQGIRADDQQALAAFTAATASHGAGPVNAIAVLNKVDTIAPESVPGAGRRCSLRPTSSPAGTVRCRWASGRGCWNGSTSTAFAGRSRRSGRSPRLPRACCVGCCWRPPGWPRCGRG